jgi:ribokinase
MNDPVRICVVGSANMDLTFRMPRLPRPGETLTGSDFHLGFGGKGANQAVMAARLGAQVSFVARLGNDAFGQASLRHYRDEGIDTSLVRLDIQRSTGVAAIMVDDSACNCILVVAGANVALSPSDVQDAAPAIRSANVVLGQLEVPLETILAAFQEARSANVRTILNPAPAMTLPDELLQLTDLCVPNETEIETLTGQRTDHLEEVAAAARTLQRRGARGVLVTLGERGALLVEKDEAVLIPAMPVTAIDPTGAGDAFIGSLAVFWATGLSLREAARRAGAIAALTVSRPGAQTAFPLRAEAEAFLAVAFGL